MSKRDLKLYLHDLNKEQLQEQIVDLYTRFKEVKEYYDFAFNPKENKLIEECKFKISKEYFPQTRRKAKCRRSVAQNYIRHFKRLGVEPALIADIMLFNVEIAQSYSAEKVNLLDSFCRSMLKSFDEAINYISDNCLFKEYKIRIEKIVNESSDQNWFNRALFDKSFSRIVESQSQI
ncbi:DUF6155 family protein [Ancylomarina sp. 16SWW S1-10-2]|uniref:DUF6155 family protein n=1 Tax=Ancylomarina sp. 16SWW S1-10-2 TaxID=2499681 RepID=UPI0012AE0896|nr:DUF6155 family protein [Ancylomarina sp. 16SWW S1-10-2]MRT94105.1 hypothetical protein [Ancylomarina sp. 16SWW S1-10-2]